MRNGWAGSIRAEAETVCLSEQDADGSSVTSELWSVPYGSSLKLAAKVGDLSTPLICRVVLLLFGLDPFAILSPITRVLRLVAVRERHVLADQLVLHIGHAAAARALSLLLRFVALCGYPPGTGRMVLARRPATAIAGFRLVDTTEGIRIVLDIALDGACPFKLFQLIGGHMRHGGSLRSADQRVAMEIGIARLVQLRVRWCHDLPLRPAFFTGEHYS
jgi:hypothetical protein